MAPLCVFASVATSAGKTPNIFLESSSQTAGTFTEKAAALGMEAFEGSLRSPENHSPQNPIFLLSSGAMPPIFWKRRSYLTFPFDEDYDGASLLVAKVKP
jgi:hypothetical protein